MSIGDGALAIIGKQIHNNETTSSSCTEMNLGLARHEWDVPFENFTPLRKVCLSIS